MNEQQQAELNRIKNDCAPASAKTPSKPVQPKSPSSEHIQERQAEASGAIALSSNAMASNAGQSLQKIDAQLSRFEDSYVETVAQRFESVPQRINAKLAARLGAVQQVDPLEALTVSVDSWDIPDLTFEYPAIAPCTSLGALPM